MASTCVAEDPVPDLTFLVESAEAAPDACAPAVRLRLRIGNLPAAERVCGIDLLCEVRIEPARRTYAPAEESRLADLFGPRDRWRETLRTVPWMQAALEIAEFRGATAEPLVLACAAGPDDAAAKYLRALEAGDVPLSLLFRGTALYEARDGALQVAPIPWTKETAFRLPVEVVRAALAPLEPPDGDRRRAPARPRESERPVA
jgi:hypothetical protein